MNNNELEDYDDVKHLVDCSSIVMLELKSNKIHNVDVLDIFKEMKQLRLLSLQGNPVVRQSKHYRKNMIASCTELTSLDERPVEKMERVACVAYANAIMNGTSEKDALQAEKESRIQFARDRDAKDMATVLSLDDLLAATEVSKEELEQEEREERRWMEKTDAEISTNPDSWLGSSHETSKELATENIFEGQRTASPPPPSLEVQRTASPPPPPLLHSRANAEMSSSAQRLEGSSELEIDKLAVSADQSSYTDFGELD